MQRFLLEQRTIQGVSSNKKTANVHEKCLTICHIRKFYLNGGSLRIGCQAQTMAAMTDLIGESLFGGYQFQDFPDD